MRPGSLTYTLTLTAPDGRTVPLGTRVVSVTVASLGGMPSWLIDDARRGTAIETLDSVHVGRSDLSPARWSASIGRSRLAITISRDTMFGVVDSHRGRSSFVAEFPRGALLSAGMMERVIEMLPLRLDYRASASLLFVDGVAPRFVRADISVEREEHVSYAGSRVECWLVVLKAGGLEQRFWVSRERARIVRIEQATAAGIVVAQLM